MSRIERLIRDRLEKGEATSREIQDYISERTYWKVWSTGSVYAILYRMEKHGFVTCRKEPRSDRNYYFYSLVESTDL